MATVSPAKEVIVQGKIATLLHLQGRLEELTELLTDFCEATREEDWKTLRSIKGVGPKTAVPFLAEMGSVTYTFEDGATFVVKYERLVAPDGSAKVTSELINGTGRFKGIKGDF